MIALEASLLASIFDTLLLGLKVYKTVAIALIGYLFFTWQNLIWVINAIEIFMLAGFETSFFYEVSRICSFGCLIN